MVPRQQQTITDVSAIIINMLKENAVIIVIQVADLGPRTSHLHIIGILFICEYQIICALGERVFTCITKTRVRIFSIDLNAANFTRYRGIEMLRPSAVA